MYTRTFDRCGDYFNQTASIVRTEGPTRLSDDGTGLDDLPSTADFIGFSEGQAS